MGLYTQVIGKTMTHGYAGSYSRQPDSVIDTHAVSENGQAICFGLGVVYGIGGAVLWRSAGSRAGWCVGLAVREI